MYLHTLMPRPKQPLQETLVADVRAAVDACAGWNARLAARRITGFLNRRMQDSSLSLAQFGLIAQIASARDDTLSELAQRTGLDQSTLSRNLQVLEAAGLVEMAAGQRDARRRAVWLTPKKTLKDVVDRAAEFEMAYNPNDCAELRWGAQENSQEAATCKRHAPQAQRAKMSSEYRTGSRNGAGRRTLSGRAHC